MLVRDRNWRPEGLMGADQNFSRNLSVDLYPENHHKPSNLGWESSYGLAISKQKALGRETKAIARKLPKQQLCWIRPVWPLAQTGQTGRAGIRNPRPIRPVAPRQPANKAPNGKSQANEVQIQRKLEDTFTTNPWTYPQEISPKRLKDLENSGENQSGLGFSQEHKNSNSWELAIPGGLALV